MLAFISKASVGKHFDLRRESEMGFSKEYFVDLKGREFG
jgi:hypothetical protein